MAVSIRISHNLPQVQRLFQQIRRIGGDPQPLLDGIAALGENSTRERFRSQTGPDGTRWKPSLRAQLTGTGTLVESSHLVDSISGYANERSAVWGVNRIYAAIHQFGGTIRAKTAGGLRFRIGGRWSTKQQVSIPARPFLGVSEHDRQDILDLVENHLANLVRQGAPGGA